jgi:hypothetical protein
MGEVLAEHHRNLVEAGDRPDLRVEITQLVGSHTPQRLEDYGAGERIYLKGSAQVLDLG